MRAARQRHVIDLPEQAMAGPFTVLVETSPVTKFSVGAEVYARLYSQYQLLTITAMGSRESKQWRKDATRCNSANNAGPQLTFLMEPRYAPWVTMMWPILLCAALASREFIHYIKLY